MLSPDGTTLTPLGWTPMIVAPQCHPQNARLLTMTHLFHTYGAKEPGTIDGSLRLAAHSRSNRVLRRSNIHKTYRFGLPILGVWTWLIAISAMAEPVNRTGSSGGTASYVEDSSSSPSAEAVRFGRRAPRVGDTMEQDVVLQMGLKLNMRRGNELIGSHETSVRSNQRRIVTSTAVENGRTTTVKVHYPEATKQVSGLPTSETVLANDPAARPEVSRLPVEGKTYFCTREPGEHGRLVISNESGHAPPEEELEIVGQQMDMVGRPNPLAEFLADRTISVDEKVELPIEVARQVYNLGEQFGEITRFTLTLQKVQTESGQRCAVFSASIEASSKDATQMHMQVDGLLVVQVDSCRTVKLDLTGPIVMSETRGSYFTAYQVIGTGRLQTRIASTYRESER